MQKLENENKESMKKASIKTEDQNKKIAELQSQVDKQHKGNETKVTSLQKEKEKLNKWVASLESENSTLHESVTNYDAELKRQKADYERQLVDTHAAIFNFFFHF